jgi:hypothetical protein
MPEPDGSWVLPLDVPRRAAEAGTPTAVAIHQLRATRVLQPAEAAPPVVVLDSGYAAGQLAQARLDGDCLVRLGLHRVLFGALGPYRGRRRPRLHGARFCVREPQTHGTPERSATTLHPVYGRVAVHAWTELHTRTAPRSSLAVIRIQVERLPARRRPPGPLWLAWIGGPLPDDLHQLWRWYPRRFVVEHAFRFLKQTLGWTTVRPRAPQAADRWTWLVRRVCAHSIPFAERRGSESIPLGQRLTRGRKPNGTVACRRSGTYPKVCGVRSRKTRAPR